MHELVKQEVSGTSLIFSIHNPMFRQAVKLLSGEKTVICMDFIELNDRKIYLTGLSLYFHKDSTALELEGI